MKKYSWVAFILVLIAGMSLTYAIAQSSGNGPCGVLSLGKATLDMQRSAKSVEIPKALLVESFKNGLKFSGSSDCPGTYEIVEMHLSIDGEREAKYDYDHTMVAKMQAMEDFMLTRYFNDALVLHFKNIKAKSSAGEIVEIPSVSFVVK